MRFLIARLTEPCSYAGLGLIVHSITEVCTNPLDAGAWSAMLSGAVAFVLPAKKL